MNHNYRLSVGTYFTIIFTPLLVSIIGIKIWLMIFAIGFLYHKTRWLFKHKPERRIDAGKEL